METIKIEVIWTFEKNLFIKFVIKTCNGERMGQNRLRDIATNCLVWKTGRFVFFFPHCWIENSFLKFNFNCKEQFLLSNKTFTFKEGWYEKALFLSNWNEAPWPGSTAQSSVFALLWLRWNVPCDHRCPLGCSRYPSESAPNHFPCSGHTFLPCQGWPLPLEAQGWSVSATHVFSSCEQTTCTKYLKQKADE